MKNLLPVYLLLGLLTLTAQAQDRASGTVFHDLNKNRVLDRDEPALAGICVSNGREVVRTGKDGRWSLPAGDDTGFFVIKPTGYMTPVNADMIPQHYYLHKPAGSPRLQVAGIAPTGNLPPSIDFPLWPQKEDKKFQALVFGDTQARGMKEVNYVTHDVVEECIGTGATLGISLGDIVADDPNLFQEINQSISQIGIPWYNVFGNHDFNRGAPDDRYTDETFERYYGPSTYAFEYGQVVFISLKNVYFNPEGKYKAHFTEQQLDFVRNYLALVPDDKLVVLVMHAPIVSCDNRKELFDILKARPHTLSIAGHTHKMAHVFADEKLDWHGPKPHHHFINATVCGSWWCGIRDETGIPHATMNDGAPNGYSLLTFDGNSYSIRFKAARRPADYQMNIYLPDDIPQAGLNTTSLVVNVFAGSSRSKVEMKIKGHTDWNEIAYTPMHDPGVAAMQVYNPFLEAKVNDTQLDTVFGWQMDSPEMSYHMWEGKLPAGLPVGTHLLMIRTQDMFGQVYTGHRIFRVR
ncbi:calcineurin-like phosphoesterase C-terminal domain-containing protein [Telluribacter humicola]|uniref:calcineurin-like phosphoesterase C-terminal domain-containing protein n=1 Tax=Telluribacter humicola TaxID=1720261 RepID=UPI001A978B1D|nr:calcineurin-like phosphoesterase family protein [Telluribacter humicola]